MTISVGLNFVFLLQLFECVRLFSVCSMLVYVYHVQWMLARTSAPDPILLVYMLVFAAVWSAIVSAFSP